MACLSPWAIGVTLCQAPESVLSHNSTLLPGCLSFQMSRREAQSRLQSLWVERGYEGLTVEEDQVRT